MPLGVGHFHPGTTAGGGGTPSSAFKPSTFNLEAPNDSEDGPWDFSAVERTITEIRAVLVGSLSPSVTWTLRFATARNAVGTEVITGGTTTTSITSGDDITAFSASVVPADNFLWLETTAQSGSVDSMGVTAVYA